MKPREKAYRLWPRVLGGVFLMALLIGGCGGWAALAQLEGAIIAAGTVKVDQNLKEVQHREGGIVKSILVRQGDRVDEGQILVRLDDVQIKAELLIVRAQLGETLGRWARLVAERDNLPAVEFPDELAQMAGAPHTVMEGERRLFAGNKLARDSQKEQLHLGIQQTEEEIRGMEARLAAKVEEVKLVGVERTKLMQLFEKQIVEYQRVYAINRDWVRILGERGEIEAGIARARGRISELRLQILAIDQNATTEAQRELRTVEAKLAELRERRLAIEDRLARTEIRSPVGGFVNELFVFTLGGVVTPAARIATIVPEDAVLTFEVKVAPVDIDQVREGQPARVRLTSFNRNTTPELAGRVGLVSRAAARDPATNLEHYVAYVQLVDDASLGTHGMRLRPGMPAEVYISTQERTAISYLTKPLTDQMGRAFRER